MTKAVIFEPRKQEVDYGSHTKDAKRNYLGFIYKKDYEKFVRDFIEACKEHGEEVRHRKLYQHDLYETLIFNHTPLIEEVISLTPNMRTPVIQVMFEEPILHYVGKRGHSIKSKDRIMVFIGFNVNNKSLTRIRKFLLDAILDVQIETGLAVFQEELVRQAKDFGEKSHEGQTRKTSGRPYFGHPMRVARILAEAGMAPHVVAAGFLHDVVEDTPVTIEAIHQRFGSSVGNLVGFNTEDKDKTWEERKSHTIDHLKLGSLEQKALVVADKYANLLEMIEDANELGEAKVWSAFKRGKDQQAWYFLGVANSSIENLDARKLPSFFQEYKQTVEEFFS